MTSMTRRVEDHDVGVAVTGDEVVVEHILHVAGIEACICNAVCLGVEARILDGLGDILHAYDRACGRGAEVGYGARAGIEVVVSVPVRAAKPRATLYSSYACSEFVW